jgi:hypothetical protein
MYKTLPICDEHNTRLSSCWVLDYSYGTYRRHIRTPDTSYAFIKKFKLAGLFIIEADLKFISRFTTFKDKKLATNTVTKYVVNFKKSCAAAFFA